MAYAPIQRSVRVLARELNGTATNYQQRNAEGSLEETLGQDNTQLAGNEPLPKANKPARKRAAPVKKSSATISRSKASHTVAAASMLSPGQEVASLEPLDGQSRKRKILVETPGRLVPKKSSTERRNDQDPDSSGLSDIGSTPEHPGLFGDQPLDSLLTVATSNDVEVNAIPAIDHTSGARSLAENAFDSSISPSTEPSLVETAEGHSEIQRHIDSIHEATEAVPSTSAVPAPSPPLHNDTGTRQKIHLKFSPPARLAASGAEESSIPHVGSGPAASLPTPDSTRQPSGRTKKQPVRFREPTDASTETAEGDSTVDEDDLDPAGDSPTVRKAARKSGAQTKANTKVPVSSEKVADEYLTEDVPAPIATKAPRKRKADTTTTERTPRKRAATPRAKAKAAKTQTTPALAPSAPLADNSDALLSLPSPPSLQSDLAADFTIDADLLKMSRSMTHREPLASKPDPIGKPEVWAPGRQELCETLPYYKSAHAGCYSNGGTVYSFMFDSTGVCREYMDSEVIIARMGGKMAADKKTGVMYQTGDHLLKDMQPQSVLNNIVHKNPLVIICGDKNEGSLTKMPHRYCVLDWFKPTHVWGEKTMGKKEPVTTIRYRFERLDRTKEPWYRPGPSSALQPASLAAPELLIESGPSAEFGSLAKAGSPPEHASPAVRASPVDLILPIQPCSVCSKSCPQVYLIDWFCTNPDCAGFWKLSNGQDVPYGELDYHPAFLQHRTEWEREDPPFSLNPGIPQTDQHFGDNLAYVSTRGVVCPECGRCNTRYMFTHWRCDTAGCKWKLTPQVQVVMPSNLSHTPWDMSSDGPSLTKALVKPAIRTQVKYFSNYKVAKYTIEGVVGSVVLAKANKHVVSEPGGADDMFRELQSVNVGLERRILRETDNTEQKSFQQQAAVGSDENLDADANGNADVDDEEQQSAGAGARMTAFGMNFGMPYKFIATGDSRSFEDAPAAVRAVRSRLNWAQRVFVNDQAGYQDFNEELIFAYLEGQKIKYHDDGEEGLGPRIATLSLGAPATMFLRMKAKYFSHVSKTGVFTDEKPLPLPLLESCGYASGHKRKAKDTSLQGSVATSRDTYNARLAAWSELQSLREKGDMAAFRVRSKEIPKDLELRRKEAETLLSFHLTHGDIVIMEGEEIQKFLEHAVEPHGHLRFAMTCRTILPHHLSPDQIPPYDVLPDQEGYDGAAIREVRDGEREAVVWE